MKLMKQELTDPEFNAISRYTGATKLDMVIDVEENEDGEIIFYDFENDEELSIEEGIAIIYDAIAYPLMHDVPYEEAVVLANLFERFGFDRPEIEE